MSIPANHLRQGMVIEYENGLWFCLEAQHRTPGNKRAFMQAKLRNIRDGTQKEFKLASDETLERVSLRERPMQFLYSDDDFYHFMDSENYEQVQLTREALGVKANFLLPESKVKITFHEDTAIGLSLPQTMTFKVIDADPGMKTATASSSYKNAKIETGVTVKVPQFVEAGDRIVVDTESGEYAERAKG